MIGFIQGKVLFSDGQESILLTASGIGHQIHTAKILAEGSEQGLYISHIVRETSEELYGFTTLKEKKTFELLTTVKNVGPKSAFAIVNSLGVNGIITAIAYEDKKSLQKAPGVGAKAAAQIVLDLSSKIQKIQMYSEDYQMELEIGDIEVTQPTLTSQANPHSSLIDDTLLACKELGFKEETVLPLAQKILESNSLSRPEQLVHLVLKEM